MSNLKEINIRIKSIKNTQKITSAMKLVAASRVRKVQQRVLTSRPYTQKLNSIISRTVSAISLNDRKEAPLMCEREVKTVGLIIISSDRGLCGSYNTNIMKKALKRISELEAEGKEIKLIVIGNKAAGFFRRSKYEILGAYVQLQSVLSVQLGNIIAHDAESAFLEGKVDKVEILGTDFISMLRSEVYIKNFLPILPQDNKSQVESEVLFEPSLNVVLNSLLPLYLSNEIFHCLLEAQCSELAARMNAMSNATNNAKDLINGLTIVYNKARQAAITQEISEIVGGAESLK